MTLGNTKLRGWRRAIAGAAGAAALLAAVPAAEATPTLLLAGDDLGGTMAHERVVVPAGRVVEATRDLELRADTIHVLGTLRATNGATITLRAARSVDVQGLVAAGDGRDGAVATATSRAVPGTAGGDLVVAAPIVTFGPMAVLAGGNGGAGGASPASAARTTAKGVRSAGAVGGSGGDVTLPATVRPLLAAAAALPQVVLGNGGAGGAATAPASAGVAARAIGRAGGESGRLVVGDAMLDDARLAQRLEKAGVLAGGRGGDGGAAKANDSDGLIPCSGTAPLCGTGGGGHWVSSYGGSTGANGVTGPTAGNPKDHAPGRAGGNGGSAYATGGAGGYGYLQGGDGGAATSYGGNGGAGGHGAQGYWPGHYNFPTCYSDCPAIAGGPGGAGGRGGYASAYGGRGGDSLVSGGGGGNLFADGGNGGRGGNGGNGGAYGVFDWSNQGQAYGEALGCLIPLPGPPLWLCVVEAGFSLEYEPVCGVGGYRGAGGVSGGANISGGYGGNGLVAGAPGTGSSYSGAYGSNGTTGAPRTSWLINFMGERPNTNYCEGVRNPY